MDKEIFFIIVAIVAVVLYKNRKTPMDE